MKSQTSKYAKYAENLFPRILLIAAVLYVGFKIQLARTGPLDKSLCMKPINSQAIDLFCSTPAFDEINAPLSLTH